MNPDKVLEYLNTAHQWMLTYQDRHGISETVENIDWFEIMGVLAMARREIEGR